MLTTLNSLPTGLLELNATELHHKLPGPTLIHLPGQKQPPLFVAVLVHGNETTGWKAIQQLLTKYADQPLPRAISLFIGNVKAAHHQKRHLEHQPDYNRIWRSGNPPTPEQLMAQQVLTDMRSRGVFAAIDIHNNTGRNPHYGCISKCDRRSLHLANLFGHSIVYFTTPNTLLSIAFAELCPSITIECGQPGKPEGTKHALAFLETCLALESIPTTPIAVTDVDLYHSVAIVKIPEHISFGFGDPASEPIAIDMCFPIDLDKFNFQELPANTQLCYVRGNGEAKMRYLEVLNEQGENVADRYFKTVNNQIVTAMPLMPSMLTLKPEIIRQDCLCYLMERMALVD
jgi:succinylglutamate desuccinylase